MTDDDAVVSCVTLTGSEYVAMLAQAAELAKEITSLLNRLADERTENMRLRRGNDDMRHTIHQWEPNMARLRADNERLRAALEEAKTALAPLATRFLYPDDIGADYAADLRAEDEWDEAANDASLDDVWIARGDIRRARAALAIPPAPSDVEQAIRDATMGGTGFLLDGERLDPSEVYVSPQPAPGKEET